MADASQNSSRPRHGAALWVEAAAKEALRTFTRSARRHADAFHTRNEKEQRDFDAQTPLFQRIVDAVDGRDVDAQKVADWMETYGQEAWIAMMSYWERLSRDVIDELMDTSQNADAKHQAGRGLKQWDRAARVVTERIVDLMMETSPTRHPHHRQDAAGNVDGDEGADDA